MASTPDNGKDEIADAEAASNPGELIVSIRAALPVDDLDRALAFYRSTLGFTSRVLSEQLGMAWMEYGDQGFLLFAGAEGSPPPGRTHTVLTIAVTDVEAMVERLTAAGVEFEGAESPINDLDGSRSAWFRDSEGNFLEVSQRP